MRPRASLLFALLGLFLALGVLAPAAHADDELAKAVAALERLEDAMDDKRALNPTLIAGLEEVMEYYRGIQPPAAPEPQAIPDDASEEEKKAIEKANKDAARDHERDLRKWERDAEKFKEDVRDALIDAFKLVRADPNTSTNRRDDVNIRAAELLGTMNETPEIAEEVSEDIIKVLEKRIFKAKNYDPTELFLEKAFGALGTLNQMDSLEWMIEEFTHTKASPPKEVMKLSAAHKAMVVFKGVPGKIRYQLVDEMVKSYAGVESQAETSSTDAAVLAKKRFWDRIKNDVIKVMQYYTGEPQDEEGQVIARMEGFQRWFRDHDNKRRAPWVDPED